MTQRYIMTFYNSLAEMNFPSFFPFFSCFFNARIKTGNREITTVVLDFEPLLAYVLLVGVLLISWHLELITLSPRVTQNNLSACRWSHHKPARWQWYPLDFQAVWGKMNTLNKAVVSRNTQAPMLCLRDRRLLQASSLQIPAVYVTHWNGSVAL